MIDRGMTALGKLARPPAVWVRSRLMAVPTSKVTFEALDYVPGDPVKQATLERHAGLFISGFNAVLASVDVAAVEERLSRVPADDRGFAYEGAGMGCAVLDTITPGRGDRLGELLRTHGEPHRFLIHVGAGWALARLKLRPRGRLKTLDPALWWLALDGFGFHEAAFHTERYVRRRARHGRLDGYELRAFDHGLGRALWFIECADPERIASTVGTFEPGRRGDIWGGVGVACGYTTVVDTSDVERLSELSGEYGVFLAQGAAFAAAVRATEGNLNPHVRVVVELLSGQSAEEVALAVDREREKVVPDVTGASYEAWRARVRGWLASGAPAAGEAAAAPPLA